MTTGTQSGTASEGEVRVRNVRTETNESGGLIQTVANLGGGVVRLGFAIGTLPLAILPADTRHYLGNAARELLHTAASLPREMAKAATEALEEWSKDTGAEMPSAPKDEMESQSPKGKK